LAWPGAAVGSLLGAWLFARLTRISALELLDDLLPLGVTLTISAWLGCWLDGCAYGPVAPNDWWGIPSVDQWGEIALRWPTQLFGAVLALGLIWAIDQARNSLSQPGLRGGLGAFGLFFQMFALSFLRADPAITWSGLRLDSWAALALAAACLIVFFWLLRKPRLAESPTTPQTTGPA
jgi:phosphatidylglycerol:prolipoprotein diacylglycerol transferase